VTQPGARKSSRSPSSRVNDDSLTDPAERSRVRRARQGRQRRQSIRRWRGIGLFLFIVIAVIAGLSESAQQVPPRKTASPAVRAALGAAGRLWMVRTRGPQPTVAVENRHAGTRSWRLPGPAADVGGLAYGSVTGYVSAPAVLPGYTERIYVDAAGSRRVRIEIFRIGWYHGAGGREVLISRWLPLVSQPPCTHMYETGLTQCDWRPTLTFRVPSALPSGVYIAKLTTHGGASDCLFVVGSTRPRPLLAQLPTSTYEAYNAWGGDSLYPGGTDRVGVTGTTQGVAVSYDRPYDSVTGAGQFFARDVAMVRFLERYGYPVSYTTSESVNDHPSQLAGHRVLVTATGGGVRPRPAHRHQPAVLRV
jgi:hypothetical protein